MARKKTPNSMIPCIFYPDEQYKIPSAFSFHIMESQEKEKNITFSNLASYFSASRTAKARKTVYLKALTDHFGGGSRVVSFDPYS